ncbi:MAG: hypothetical protein PHR56_05860 [Dehalococcoidales bacterium]|nr:hypothetical protein [Dehalococcoidales bacterium]
MSARAYLLLNILEGKSEQVARLLRGKPGVLSADALEGRPDVIVMVEAADRRTLAEMIMPAISSIDQVTEDLRLLVTRDTATPATQLYRRTGINV